MNQEKIANGWQIRQLPDDFPLDGGFPAEEARGGEWLPAAKFPAQIHDVLRQNGLIGEPWLPGKAEEYAWVAQKSWLYRVAFSCGEPGRRSKLCFGGLDTVCRVFLNGEQVLYADDSYVPWEADVTGRLKGENELLLLFPSVARLADAVELPAELSGRAPKTLGIRKMPQDFRDYLGPKPCFTRVGAYRDVTLKQYGAAGFSNCWARASLNGALDAGAVIFHAEGFLLAKAGNGAAEGATAGAMAGDRAAEGAGNGAAERAGGGAKEAFLELRVRACGEGGGGPAGPAAAQTFALGAPGGDGSFCIDAEIAVPSPALWWPRGHGEQRLYLVELELRGPDGNVEDAACFQTGFRRIDSPEPYRFVVNGKRITLMGGNFGPLDMATLCWDRDRMNRLFDLAENAFFNVMRMWGETGPSDDHFYEECDRRGILVWRDLCNSGLIPEDGKYAAYRLREAEYQIPHLMAHPCVLVWCGNNESYLWASRKTLGDGRYIGRRTMLKLKEICRRFDPDRHFVESSPSLGAFPNDPRGGNTHGYTNMWFVPGYDYLRFATEDTRISAPGLKSLRRFMRPEEIWPEGSSLLHVYGKTLPWPDSWQFYTTSLGERKVGPIEEFYDADGPEALVYRLGAASGAYYRRAIETFRRGRPSDRQDEPRNGSGYLVWKFNDSWPEIYSAKVDYFLEPYMAYYYIRRAYAPLAVMFDIGSFVHAWVANDTPERFDGTLRVCLHDMQKGETIARTERAVSVEAGESKCIVRLDEFAQFDRGCVLSAELFDAMGDLAASATDFAEMERRLVFPDARLSLSFDGGELSIASDAFARCVELSGRSADGDPFGWVFEDNYFDLMPGAAKKVRLLPRAHAPSGLQSGKASDMPSGGAAGLPRDRVRDRVRGEICAKARFSKESAKVIIDVDFDFDMERR